MLVALAQATFQIRHITGVTQRFATGDMQRLLRVPLPAEGDGQWIEDPQAWQQRGRVCAGALDDEGMSAIFRRGLH